MTQETKPFSLEDLSPPMKLLLCIVTFIIVYYTFSGHFTKRAMNESRPTPSYSQQTQTQDTKTTSSNSALAYWKEDDFNAKYACHTLVKEQLISPTSAKFPYSNYEYKVYSDVDSILMLESYVDSQNGFWATIRTRYSCALNIQNQKIVNGWIQLIE